MEGQTTRETEKEKRGRIKRRVYQGVGVTTRDFIRVEGHIKGVSTGVVFSPRLTLTPFLDVGHEGEVNLGLRPPRRNRSWTLVLPFLVSLLEGITELSHKMSS